MMQQSRARFGRFVVRKLPVGIAAAPFEFAFMLGYAISTGKVLVDLMDSSGSSRITLAALPFGHGYAVYYWVALLFVGTLTALVGLLTVSKRPLLGLQVERAGLYAAGAAVTVYLGKIIVLVGLGSATTSIGLLAVFLQLLAIAYKILLINQTLHHAPTHDKNQNPGDPQ